MATLGDQRFDPAHWYLPKESLLGFVEVPAGPFQMGDDLQEIEVPGFYIARYPVTVAQFRAFVESSGYEKAHPYSLGGLANEPVVAVDWYDAMAYCRWLAERLRELAGKWEGEPVSLWSALSAGNLAACLPSEAEWEKAARGTDGRVYPWGEAVDPNRANYDATGLSRMSAVGCFPGGISPYGCEEMSGNVWEWTRSRREDEHENMEVSSQSLRVVRGGAFHYGSRSVRCAYRGRDFPVNRYDLIGFRVVLSPFRSDL